VRHGQLRWTGISNEEADMIECPLREALKWWGQNAGANTHGVIVPGKICTVLLITSQIYFRVLN